jgi:hypothetical protein
MRIKMILPALTEATSPYWRPVGHRPGNRDGHVSHPDTYPGTALYWRISEQGRLTVHDWDVYDTRHAVFRPARMSAAQLEGGYQWAYREFYRWRSILRGASAHEDLMAGLRHLAYSAGWKKFEPLWDFIIRARRAGTMLPVLETILSESAGALPARHLAIGGRRFRRRNGQKQSMVLRTSVNCRGMCAGRSAVAHYPAAEGRPPRVRRFIRFLQPGGFDEYCRFTRARTSALVRIDDH